MPSAMMRLDISAPSMELFPSSAKVATPTLVDEERMECGGTETMSEDKSDYINE